MSVSEESQELRCVCRALLARATTSGIELKCPRCKRTVLIPYAQLDGKEHLVRFMTEWRRHS